MRWLCMLVAVSVAGVIAGCTDGGGTAAVAPSRSTAASSSITSSKTNPPTSSTAPTMPLSEVERRLGEAMLTNDALAGQAFKAEGAIQSSSSTTVNALTPTCNIRPLSDYQIRASKLGNWSIDQQLVTLRQTAVYYGNMPGVTAIAEIRQILSCGTYTQSDQVQFRLTGELTVPPAAGVDTQYAYCEQSTDADSVTECTILLARGNVATSAVIVAYDASIVRQLITKITPLLAAALTRAS